MLAKVPKIILIILVLTLTVFLLFIAQILTNLGRQKSFENFFHGSGNIFSPKEDTEEKIAKIITNATASQDGRWAVYVKDLNRQKTYEYNSGEIFPSASLYKLAVMYKAYDALENGQLQKGTPLAGNKTELDNALQGLQNKEEPTGREEETISYSVAEALRLMIIISDNYSALILAQNLGWQQIDNLMKSEGFATVNLVGQNSPTVSAKSVADLLERIYSNKAISANASGEMKQLLFNQKVNDRIPKYLPEGTKVAHKTGELDQIRHDAGIVLGKNSAYIFVFLTETSQPQDTAETIAQLSKEIFEALEK